MRKVKQGLELLSLGGLVLLSLMAFAAPAAQAEGEFIVLGSTKLFPVSVTGKAEGSSAFLVPSLGLELICEQATIEGQLKAGGHGEQKLALTNCKVPNEVPCFVIEPLVAEFLTTVVNHAGETWIKFTPPAGKEAFTTINFKSGTGCPLPLKNVLKGAFIALISGEKKQQLLTFLTDESTKKLFKVEYSFGTSPAILEMSAVWELTGPHTGCTWGAI